MYANVVAALALDHRRATELDHRNEMLRSRGGYSPRPAVGPAGPRHVAGARTGAVAQLLRALHLASTSRPAAIR